MATQKMLETALLFFGLDLSKSHNVVCVGVCNIFSLHFFVKYYGLKLAYMCILYFSKFVVKDRHFN